MASYASSLLDELMGRHRDANPDDKPKEPHWSDPEVALGTLLEYYPILPNPISPITLPALPENFTTAVPNLIPIITLTQP